MSHHATRKKCLFRVSLHGGMCCGIKHISGFSHIHPKNRVDAQEYPDPIRGLGRDRMGYSELAYGHDATCGNFPEQSAEDRLAAIIEAIQTKRPCHLIEVTLSFSRPGRPYPSPFATIHGKEWEQVLKSLGFVLVTEFKNCNTSNTVKVFHLAYDSTSKE